MSETQRLALKMIAAILTTGIVILVVSCNPLPLIMMVAVAYAIWRVAKYLN